MNGFFSSVSGSAAQEIWLEKVTNNLANVNTAGYKGDHLSFESLLLGGEKGATAPPSSSVSLIMVRDGLDLGQGTVKMTGNPLDFAIEGEGFFVVDTPDGIRYTRNGVFTLDNEGRLVTQQGYAVMGEKGEIEIGGGKVEAAEDGTLAVNGREIGKIRIVTVDDPRYLSKEGENLFRILDGGGEGTAEEARVVQGALEMSNVNVIREMTRLININRAYSAYQKVIQAMNEAGSKVMNEVGRAR